MEIINLMIILSTSIICIIWAIRKKKDIEAMRVNMDDENIPLEQDSKKQILLEQEDLEYTSKIIHDIIMSLLKKIFKISSVIFGCVSIAVWIFFEDKIGNFA